MGALLSNFRNTFIVSLLLSVALIAYFATQSSALTYGNMHQLMGHAAMRWMHVFFGILWIGLLYYFNFVQIRTMPKIPDELKPAIGKFIAPEALFWFRWAAIATMVLGLAIAGMPPQVYLVEALTFQAPYRVIGLGMWLGIIMAANVWMFIWPNQKIALGLVEADADAKAAAGKKAMLFSRTNFVLSFPMLYCMVTQYGQLG